MSRFTNRTLQSSKALCLTGLLSGLPAAQSASGQFDHDGLWMRTDGITHKLPTLEHDRIAVLDAPVGIGEPLHGTRFSFVEVPPAFGPVTDAATLEQVRLLHGARFAMPVASDRSGQPLPVTPDILVGRRS